MNDSDPSLAKIRKLARAAALGTQEGRRFSVTGTTSQFQNQAEYTFEQMPDAKYLRRIAGELSRAQGFDGQVPWEVDYNGAARTLYFKDRDRIHAINLVQFGGWLLAPKDLDIRLNESRSTESAFALELRFKDGIEPAILLLDRKSHLPASLELASNVQAESATFTDYRTVEGLTVPYKATFVGASGRHTETVERVDFDGPGCKCECPATRSDGVVFSTKQRELDTKRAVSGHLLVKLTVNDQAPSWFVLDTGAGGVVIDKRLAKKLGLKSLGKIGLVSAYGRDPSDIVRLDAVNLGAVNLGQVIGSTMDTSIFDDSAGETIAGIIGYGLLAKVRAEIDLNSDRISIRNPEAPTDGISNWRPLMLDRKLPLFAAQLSELPTANYRIDLGASGSFFGNVIFHTPYVTNHHLVDRYATGEFELPPHKFRTGVIDRFVLGDRVFEQLESGFAVTDLAPLNEPYSAGNIGIALLKHFTITLDYSNQRYAIRANGH